MKKDQLRPILGELTKHPASIAHLLAELTELNTLTLDELEIYARSTFARSYSKDIKSARIHDYADRTVLQLESNREGYYDQLPQGLFHRPKPRDSRDKADDRIETYKTTRAQEAAARKFFFPFEQDSFFFRIKMELTERRLIDPIQSSLRERMLLDIWPACRNLPRRFYPILSYILPLSYRVAGDLNLMETCYKAICGAPINMRYVMVDDSKYLSNDQRPNLIIGAALGVDTVLEGQPAAELPHLEMTIGPLPRQRTTEYLEGGVMQQVLGVLNDCLVPLDVTIVQRLEYERTEELFVLAEDADKASYLGYTSRLTNPAAAVE